MTILFLYVGSAFFLIGLAIIISELKGFSKTTRVLGKVVGYANAVKESSSALSFRTVVEYRGRDSQTRYVISPIGSSAPLKYIGKKVLVRESQTDPKVVSVESSITFFLGGMFALMGAGSIFAFYKTFTTDWFSIGAAVFITAGVGRTIFGVLRKTPLKLSEWQNLRKKATKPEVYLESEKSQIPWVDPILLTSTIQRIRKNYRVVAPVSFILGVVALIFGIQFYESTTAHLKTALTVEGVVVDFKSKHDSDGTVYRAVVEYHTPDTKQALRFEDSISASHPIYEIGDQVKVLLDPNAQEKPQIDRGIWNYFLSILLFGLGSFFLWLGFHCLKVLRHITGNSDSSIAPSARSSRGA
ncbi:MAG: DUF3592 domain-containing protein [Bdellovibrionota bacterium]